MFKFLKKVTEILRYLAGIPKTLYFNFKYFDIKTALKFPVIISSKVSLRDMRGEIILEKIKPAIVRIGFGSVEMYDYKYERTIFSNSGKIIFKGKSKIGFGSVISNEGELIIGDKFFISAKGKIVCRKRIEIGNNSMMAWESLIMDTDHHHIYNYDNKKINENKSIKIGEGNWIGARVSILKGAEIGDGNMIALGTILNKKIEGNDQIIGGNPPKILKKNISWKE
jgi:acetyltransferase-like isoleucine patch superfamily enzyme